MAAELIEAIGEFLVDDEEWARRMVDLSQPRGPLRFETAMEWLTETADPELEVLSFLDDARPGPMHEALAWAAGQGVQLLTVNFDDLVERLLPLHGLSPTAIDAHRPQPKSGGGDGACLLKLHGTRLLHEAGRHPSPLPLHATISTIVRGGGGDGLPEAAHALLDEAIAGKHLLVLGYSGSDDLDVMPSLERCRPGSVTWVQHEPGPVREDSLDGAATPGTKRLLGKWQSAGIDVRAVRGDTTAYLQSLGWEVPPPLPPAEMARRRDEWRARIASWAKVAKADDPSGLGWISVCMGAGSRYDDALRAAEQSTPSTKPRGGWSAQRRLYELAQGAYHDPEATGETVLKLAAEARDKAVENDDPGYAAHSEILAARQWIELRDYEQAGAALDRGVVHLDGASGEYAYGRAYHAEWKARLHIFEDNADAAQAEAKRAADLFAAHGYWVESCESLQVAGQAAWLKNDLGAAVEPLDRAIEIARKGPYFDQLAAALDRRAHVAYQEGDIEGAYAYARESSEVAFTHNLENEIEQQLSLWGTAANELGHFEEALEAFSAGRSHCDPRDTTWRPDIVLGLADTLLHLGQPSQALAVLEEEQETIGQDLWDLAHAESIRLRADGAASSQVDAAITKAQEESHLPYARQILSIIRLHPGTPAAEDLVTQAEEELRDPRYRLRLKRLRSWLQARAAG